MDLITFRKLSNSEKDFYLKQAQNENKLEFLFSIGEADWEYIRKQKVYGGFYKNEMLVFYYFYGWNENTLKIAFSYLGKFNKTKLKIIKHCLASFRQEYGIIGEVNSENTSTIKLCKKLWDPVCMIMQGADRNNTDRYIFYWNKTRKEN